MNTDGLYATVMNIPVVGVAMGLMFTYLITSLVSSAIKEAVASVFEWRGTYLQHGIGVLLSNAPGSSFTWRNPRKWLAAHLTWMDLTRNVPGAVTATTTAADAAVRAISAAKFAAAAAVAAAANPTPALTQAATAAATSATDAATAAAADGATARGAIIKARRPDSTALAMVVAHVVDKTTAAVVSRAAADLADAEKAVATARAALSVFSIQTHPLLKGTPTKLPSYVPARDFATAMLDMLRDSSASPVFNQVVRTVDTLPDGDVKQILSAFIADAAGDPDKLRARIEEWFDDAMDRLSGIYKRFAQYFLLTLGLVIAATLNINSVHMAIALWNQPALRAQIIAQVAAKVPASNPRAVGGTQAPGTVTPVQSDAAQANNAAVHDAIQQLQSLPLPIGRMYCASFFGEPLQTMPDPNAPCPNAPTNPNNLQGWLTWAVSWQDTSTYSEGWTRWNRWTLLGWVITGFAISLGAPFWFGLLQNIMNLRGAGAPPQRSDAQAASS